MTHCSYIILQIYIPPTGGELGEGGLEGKGKKKRKKKRNRPPPPSPRCRLMDTDCRDQFSPGASISVDSWNSRQSEERERVEDGGDKEWEIHIDCGDPSGVRSRVTRLCENICSANCQRAGPGRAGIYFKQWLMCYILPSASVSARPPCRPPSGSGRSDIYLGKCDCGASAVARCHPCRLKSRPLVLRRLRLHRLEILLAAAQLQTTTTNELSV